jgi:hypothetical protein
LNELIKIKFVIYYNSIIYLMTYLLSRIIKLTYILIYLSFLNLFNLNFYIKNYFSFFLTQRFDLAQHLTISIYLKTNFVFTNYLGILLSTFLDFLVYF